jgi:hypothetical protein
LTSVSVEVSMIVFVALIVVAVKTYFPLVDRPAPRSERGRLVERHVRGAFGVHETREGVNRSVLVPYSDLQVRSRGDDRERLRPGGDTALTDALEPGPHIVGSNEVDDAAGSVSDVAPPPISLTGSGEARNDENDANKT